jgi:hypothetical protein
LNNTIFHQIKNKSILDIRSEVERFQKIRSDNSRNAVLKYLVSISLNHQISKMGSLEFLFTVMKEAGVPKQTIHDTRKELIKIMEYAKPAKQVSVMTLINELQKKFAA